MSLSEGEKVLSTFQSDLAQAARGLCIPIQLRRFAPQPRCRSASSPRHPQALGIPSMLTIKCQSLCPNLRHSGGRRVLLLRLHQDRDESYARCHAQRIGSARHDPRMGTARIPSPRPELVRRLRIKRLSVPTLSQRERHQCELTWESGDKQRCQRLESSARSVWQ